MASVEVLLTGHIPNLLLTRVQLLATAGIRARALTIPGVLSHQDAAGACLLLILCHSVLQDEAKLVAEAFHEAHGNRSHVAWMRMSLFSPAAPPGVDDTLPCMPREFIQRVGDLRALYQGCPPESLPAA